MESRRNHLAGLGVIVGVVALVVAAMLPERTTSGTVDDKPLDTDRLTVSTALVAQSQATGGWEIAGLRLGARTYRLDLMFLASDDCSGSDGSVSSPCPGPDGLTGEVVGRTAAGDIILNARVEVSRRCHDLAQIGDEWPVGSECEVLAPARR